MEEKVGRIPYVIPALSVTDCPSRLVTTTLAAPIDPAGVMQVKVVPDKTLGLVQAAPPMVAVAPSKKPEPVNWTDVPPVELTTAGESESKVGMGLNR